MSWGQRDTHAASTAYQMAIFASKQVDGFFSPPRKSRTQSSNIGHVVVREQTPHSVKFTRLVRDASSKPSGASGVMRNQNASSWPTVAQPASSDVAMAREQFIDVVRSLARFIFYPSGDNWQTCPCRLRQESSACYWDGQSLPMQSTHS